jgi:hypothetical protein
MASRASSVRREITTLRPPEAVADREVVHEGAQLAHAARAAGRLVRVARYPGLTRRRLRPARLLPLWSAIIRAAGTSITRACKRGTTLA